MARKSSSVLHGGERGANEDPSSELVPMRRGTGTKFPESSWEEPSVTMKSLSIMWGKGPGFVAVVLIALFSSSNGRERRHSSEEVVDVASQPERDTTQS